MPDLSGQRGSWSGSARRPSKCPPRSVPSSNSSHLSSEEKRGISLADRPIWPRYSRQSSTLESAKASRAQRASRHADAVVAVTGSVFAEKQLRPHRLGHSEERKASAPSGGLEAGMLRLSSPYPSEANGQAGSLCIAKSIRQTRAHRFLLACQPSEAIPLEVYLSVGGAHAGLSQRARRHPAVSSSGSRTCFSGCRAQRLAFGATNGVM